MPPTTAPESAGEAVVTSPAAPVARPWAAGGDQVLAATGSTPGGLTSDDAARRAQVAGPNRLAPPERPPLWRRVLRQFDDVLIYVLLVAAVLKAILGDWIDFTIILLVAVVNAAIGFIQEGRAESALEGIRTMLSSSAEVRRDGAWSKVDASVLVPGDVVRVRAGDRVPADVRLLEASNLRVDESALTGESVPAGKDPAAVDAQVGVGDRTSMLFSGTIVAAGTGAGVVVAIGQSTEIGRIQTLVESAESLETPLTRQLGRFGKQIAVLILVLGLFMAVVGHLVHHFAVPELISASIGFAVAAVPEGLPALVTITLALGVQQMARRRAIVRRLPAVETLGAVSTICSDKTGTLTRNEMTARTVRTAAGVYGVSGEGYAPDGAVTVGDAASPGPVAGSAAAPAPGELVEVTPDHDVTADETGTTPVAPVRTARLDERPDLAAVIEVMALCNDARVVPGDGGAWTLVGEPTEGALRTLSLKAEGGEAGRPGSVSSGWERLDVLPFDSVEKYMVTLDRRTDDRAGAAPGDDGSGGDEGGRAGVVVHLKGAPDRVLERCTTQTGADGRPEPLDRDLWTDLVDTIGARGLRVLAAARTTAAPGTTRLADVPLDDLELCGLVGIVDPPRAEAVEAIAECHRAGISVKMITGDHAGTAVAIARELGIVDDAGHPRGPGSAGSRSGAPAVLTGAELEAMTPSELRAVVRDVDVYARTSPEHKIRIVAALQAHHQVVAMTGDGVNDAPALRQADVGVAMGIKGTEATKEAAEVVLADDNFATIERAVEEGRRIYDNIRKSVLFLLPTNGAQALVILVAVLFGLTMPITPVQVLWINMVTAVTLSLSLAYEKGEPGIMRRPPRDPDVPLVDGRALRRVLLVSVLIGGITLAVFYVERALGTMTVEQARTTAVTTLALTQLAYLFSCRFLERSSLTLDVLRGNRMVWVSAVSLVALQLLFVYAPFMHTLFGSASVGWRGWWVPLLAALVVFGVVELVKAVDRARGRRQADAGTGAGGARG